MGGGSPSEVKRGLMLCMGIGMLEGYVVGGNVRVMSC